MAAQEPDDQHREEHDDCSFERDEHGHRCAAALPGAGRPVLSCVGDRRLQLGHDGQHDEQQPGTALRTGR